MTMSILPSRSSLIPLFILGSLLMASACSTPKAPDTDTNAKADTDAKADAAQADKPPEQATEPVDINNPESCRACHAPIVEEWEQSMHSRAHYDKDPIFANMRDLRVKRQGEIIVPKCRNCHNPRDTKDESTPAAKAGVSCAACHNAAHVEQSDMAKGAKLISYDESGVLLGARNIAPDASPAHPTGPAAPHLSDGSSICLACHSNTANPAGVPACTTGSEISSGSHAEASCASCHMPKVKGSSGPYSDRAEHASHTFPGPHRAYYQADTSLLEQAVDLSLSWQGDELIATATNKSGHSFPSGFPGRMAMVKVRGFDAAGAEVWTNIKDNPPAEDPSAVFFKIYIDEEGKPTMPPFAKELKSDTRLSPDEIRTLRWTPPQSVKRAEAIVVYRLMPPKVAKALGLTEAPEAQAIAFSKKKATREEPSK